MGFINAQFGPDVPGGPKYIPIYTSLNKRADEAHDDSRAWFPAFHESDHVLQDIMLCLIGEVGESANLIKKHIRGTMTLEELMQKLPEEIVDIQVYLFNLMGYIANKIELIDWEAEYDAKRAINAKRFGSGSSRRGARVRQAGTESPAGG